MADIQRLKQALINADAAGDVQAAKKIANAIRDKQSSQSWSSVAGRAIKSIPSSAMQFAEDITAPIHSPVQTAKALGNFALGGVQKLIPGEQENEKYADAVGDYFSNRYGSETGFKEAIATDPVGVLGDFATVLTGGGAAAAKLPGLAGKVAKTAQKVGTAIDPVNVAVKAARKAPSAIGGGLANVTGGLGTHTGGEALKEAFQAGSQGGKRAESFRSGMAGTADMEGVLGNAKQALSNMREQRGIAYRAEMKKLEKQPDVLDFNKIDDEVSKVAGVGKFEGVVINPSTAETFSEISNALDEWRSLDPSVYHTALGLDALKKRIGDIRNNTDPGSSSRLVVDRAYNAVKKVINEQDPKYADIMKDYEKATTLTNEIERALSLGEKASADTAIRKLQSLMRNNVQTNYGQRVRLADELVQAGADELMPTVAGQALSSVTPRGLGSIPAMGILAGGAATMNPMLLGMLPFQSPRLMGEAAYGAGVLSRPAMFAAEKMSPVMSAAEKAAIASTIPRLAALQSGKTDRVQQSYLLNPYRGQ